MVLERLKKLKFGKTPGVDNLARKVLVETEEYICKPLALIFNQSMATSIVPRDWKQANVSVVFQKGSKNQASN